MRDILNVSLSKDLLREVDAMVKKGKYSSKSEFVRDLIRERIAEADLLKRLRQSQKEIARGQGKVLRSLKDLR